MSVHPVADVHLLNVIMALVVALVWTGLFSFVAEPNRQLINAILVAGASGAYLNGGFGPYEFVFALSVLFCAYKGLTHYRFIGLGWLLHTGWDIAHHVTGHPMLSLLLTSSAECAITDTLLAAWFFAGAPTLGRVFGNRFFRRPA